MSMSGSDLPIWRDTQRLLLEIEQAVVFPIDLVEPPCDPPQPGGIR